MNQWKAIWNNRKVEETGSTLNRLLQADGYDTSFGKIDASYFLSYIPIIEKKLGIGVNDSLFEVGCGSGAVLYPFYRQGFAVSGLDYSQPLIQVAREVMPEMHFYALEADQLDVRNQSDIVFSFGVFIYFADYGYAETVIRKMIGKARKSVGIFDISDLDLRKEAETLRRESMGPKAYAERYRGLSHLYYPRSFFHNLAKELECHIHIFPQSLGGYTNSRYRYNVIFYKKGISARPDTVKDQ